MTDYGISHGFFSLEDPPGEVFTQWGVSKSGARWPKPFYDDDLETKDPWWDSNGIGARQLHYRSLMTEEPFLRSEFESCCLNCDPGDCIYLDR